MAKAIYAVIDVYRDGMSLCLPKLYLRILMDSGSPSLLKEINPYLANFKKIV